MEIKIKVKTQAKDSKIIPEKNILKASVKSPAKEGKANKELIETLSDYYTCPKSSIQIIKGHKNREKVVRIKQILYKNKLKTNLSKKHCWAR